MLFGIGVFIAGSALSGAAQTMNELIAFRAFQGLGAAALQPIAIAIIGDLFPPRERGKWQGVSGSVYALAAIVGPLAGGWITDHTSWRWVFYINVPVGIVALLVLIFLMPTLRSKAGQVSIDYVGAMLLILGTVPLLLGFTLAGNQYAWLSPQILVMFGGAVVALTALVFYAARLERQGREPIFESGLIKNSVRIFGVSLLVTVIYSVSLYGTSLAIPLFAQGVLGTTATSSGLSRLRTSLRVTSPGRVVRKYARSHFLSRPDATYATEKANTRANASPKPESMASRIRPVSRWGARDICAYAISMSSTGQAAASQMAGQSAAIAVASFGHFTSSSLPPRRVGRSDCTK